MGQDIKSWTQVLTVMKKLGLLEIRTLTNPPGKARAKELEIGRAQHRLDTTEGGTVKESGIKE